MSLSREEVLKVAKLAKLKFSEEKIEKFQEELNDILGYVDMLNEVDTTEVEPLIYVHEAQNHFREDEARASLKVEEVLRNAPNAEDGAIIVPRVVGEE
ncbi:Asp-tRNA(Asn)/Glu-tRNA(Gln) amidotransferase subunit GatC [Fusobacterium necrophorum]|uniref:Aspartyl/glutamyl-tRNA(Asn/Gln) amidotransferase subunit C n=2 Tax=Fusobacterium necrophorum subsp. funduliforme TaxID=143387 RepID=A0A162IU93_9FUSO|nr:Asp-tRNA(Asn)/Glu-tRNA(Gln) amidotransferase subunit GatC [Fusobacterium necrophorum]AYV92526.1 Asp-tRNA(Asn)/Glu-tRNA(Gln) amidotransferase subunit GatC [Fusobacterium necrophorum subsp. funduliforme]EYD69969.1 glutamyl-tRNA(Gln) amidotransferase subunit C [Fusobacterium necrophorum subsp. funduliforme B35]KID48547.1 aspartyl/glutamyl-tRNA amidotransferase subunit C [Fusobacterium necrophorum subsp. funduliforme B35]KYL04469.1 asparaginyl/glutamyl-tRNA amidotransferase subunit C [Fusobacter